MVFNLAVGGGGGPHMPLYTILYAMMRQEGNLRHLDFSNVIQASAAFIIPPSLSLSSRLARQSDISRDPQQLSSRSYKGVIASPTHARRA